MEEIRKIFEKQKANRWAVSKSSAAERIAKLKKIKRGVLARQDEIQKAVYDDFKKNPAETNLTEIFTLLSEINHTVRHLKKWMKPKRVGTPLALFGTRSEVRYEAKGLVLILSPWNYPFQLAMVPLVTAVAAGNCVILKPSAKVPNTSMLLKKIISEIFDESEVAVIEGDHKAADFLLELPFDHIFFTGSPAIGKKVMTAAAQHLSPVTLELGGKSPVIIDDTADIKKAAERIMWGKFINAGQTCVAPDYLLIHEGGLQEFVSEAKKVIAKRYGTTGRDQENNPSFCRLVSEGHLNGIKKVLDESVQRGAKIETGGETSLNGDGRFLSPTLLTNVTDDSPIMKEEIFGPVLPIITFRSLDEVFKIIRSREKPLALYIFSKNKENVETILSNTTAGGSCVNSLVIHLGNTNLPFGGVGQSGMGNYHGLYGFRTLSHERAVLHQGKIDALKAFYPPYTKFVGELIAAATRFLS